ncbi:putative superfamily III holin-X [Prauserella shujinwangii]|uniref:Putative superfamily III holin-X n=1 Tax=Prauserella shujinwangii TaxID=1453103 RepID=A0A2T0LNP7_9PSEU|nr:phage holin family protein [Prauserella shujinwangii]PRX44779.1 putative superfamily III holin-X [Prauserella shujinwangii]
MTPVSSPKHERNDPDGVGTVPYLPLSEDDGYGEVNGQSVGALVKDATQHLSTLFRAEVELVKSETVSEAKKAAKGSVFFAIAAVVALYSSFFFFFFLGELLSEWLQRWAAFLIVFGLMLALAAVLGLLGYRKWKKVRAPQRSIDSIRETAAALRPRRTQEDQAHPAPGAPSPDPR